MNARIDSASRATSSDHRNECWKKARANDIGQHQREFAEQRGNDDAFRGEVDQSSGGISGRAGKAPSRAEAIGSPVSGKTRYRLALS